MPSPTPPPLQPQPPQPPQQPPQLTRSTDPLVWIDCEMTGLDPSTDTILSLSCFITSASLVLLDPTGFDAVIHHSSAFLAATMTSPWCITTHNASGLTAAVLASSTAAAAAADSLLAYIVRHVPEPRTALLAGNSVHADKAFLSKEPWDRVLRHLHYRILDISAIKEAARRWAPLEVLEGAPRKLNRHEARADVLESIEEARYWMKGFERMRKLGGGEEEDYKS